MAANTISPQEAAVLSRCSLFPGISPDELSAILGCLDFQRRSFDKDEFICHRGDSMDEVGVVIVGAVHMITEDYWGNRNILGLAGPSQIFGESFACVAGEVSHVDVVAAEKCEVIFLGVRRICTTCSSACTFHVRLIGNLLSVIARKNVALTDKVECISKRSLREKILSYLSSESQINASPSFDIPFNRQQLADYLSADRSALSNGLCKLRDEGLISFDKNHFELHLA